MRPPISSFPLRTLTVTSVLIALVGLFVITGNAPVHSTSLDTVSAAQGALTNGANHTGVIGVGDLDTWTIQATLNDGITVSIGEVAVGGPEPNFTPRIRLLGPDGAELRDDSGFASAELDVRAPQTGTYTVLVSHGCCSQQVGPGSYVLTVAKTPGPYTISSGDEGGPLTNGANHTGVIGVGDLDTWTIQATLNDGITVSIGEVAVGGPEPNFGPRIRLLGPDGAELRDDSGFASAELDVRAPQTGTYTVLVSHGCCSQQVGPGSYVLTVAKTPGPYTISSGDEGGPLTNGANHTGVIGVGDLDTWTIQATLNDGITVSIGEVAVGGPEPNFGPRIRLLGPDGAELRDDSGFASAELDVRAPQTGTYTVLVSHGCCSQQVGPGSYVLTVAKTPGPYTISPGDEGGPLTNGANHTGVIGVGDLDTWTIQATLNDGITVSIGEVAVGGPEPNFGPRIRLLGPDGAELRDDSGFASAELDVRAPQTGTYTVLVSHGCCSQQVGPGSYVLTVAKTPGPYTISPDDEGGPLTNGANHTGVIGVGDLDTWTIQATLNDGITVSIGEVVVGGPEPNFGPRIRLLGPDGAELRDDSGFASAELDVRAPQTGTYTVLVSHGCCSQQVGPGSYVLTVAKTPGPYTISPDDEGGPLTNGANHTGVIGVGDLDTWTIQATLNDGITVSIGEVVVGGPEPNFGPRIRLLGPDGAELRDDSGFASAELDVRAPQTGTYTVLVSHGCCSQQVGPGSYVLTVAKTPGPYTISPGDEGGPLINGAQTGVIGVGDLDAWSFQASQNSGITVSIGEVVVGGPEPNFGPRIRLLGPDGTSLADNSGTNSAQISGSAPLTGIYTVLVSHGCCSQQVGPGSYTLTFSGPPQPTLSINNVTQNEGNIGTTPFTFNATLSGQTFQTVTVNYATANGTATAASDYTSIPPTQLAFNPGDPLTKNVTVLVSGDTSLEPNETFVVNLSGALGILVSDAQGIGTINNDDATIQFSSGTYSVNENGGSATITATRTGSNTGAVSAQYATSNGTANAGQDYTAASGTLNWADGDTAAKTFNVPITDDSVFEGNETVDLTLNNPTGGATIGTPNTAVLTIVDNETQPTNLVQFSSSTYSVQEDCTFVNVTVNRVGDLSAAATVDYTTSDVTATERRDYITAVGKLSLAAGETSKTFAVLINEDSHVEGNETFNVTLSNPSGVSLGTSGATVTINDDLTEPATNAIDDAADFACQHYHDFLNRQPDASGLAFWTNEITSCGSNQSCIEVKRINVSAAFYLSIEFQGTGYLVERVYKAAYGDETGTSTFGGTHPLPVPVIRLNEFLSDSQEIGRGVIVGQTGWEMVLENNKQAFTSEFVQRSRFLTAFPATMTPAEFVDKLNANAGNSLSLAERNQLVGELTANAKTRAQVLRAVAEDPDLINAEFNRAFVLMQFFGYLRRNPNDPQDSDYTGYDFWLTKLTQFNGDFQNAEMVKAFITSTEYRQRFGP